jgi:hypothetical protein
MNDTASDTYDWFDTLPTSAQNEIRALRRRVARLESENMAYQEALAAVADMLPDDRLSTPIDLALDEVEEPPD